MHVPAKSPVYPGGLDRFFSIAFFPLYIMSLIGDGLFRYVQAVFIAAREKLCARTTLHSAATQWKCCGSQTQTIYFQTKAPKENIQQPIFMPSLSRMGAHRTPMSKKNKRPINREICFCIHDLKTIFIFVFGFLSVRSFSPEPVYR